MELLAFYDNFLVRVAGQQEKINLQRVNLRTVEFFVRGAEYDRQWGKIPKILRPPKANIPKNIIMRQEFALKLLVSIRKKTTMLCIEETTLKGFEYARMK